jgi:exosome complex RNA-binding protein Rrp42 (RNase PH superfamily)
MPRETGPSINERQFFQKALQENLRIDGRAFDQFRALELDFGDEYGVADVRLGKTRCVFPLANFFALFLKYCPQTRQPWIDFKSQGAY